MRNGLSAPIRTVAARWVSAVVITVGGLCPSAAGAPRLARADAGEAGADPAPSQRLPTDPPVPHPLVAVETDLVGAATGRYGLRVAWAPLPWVGLLADVGVLAAVDHRPHLALAGALWPLGDGLRGLWLAAGAELGTPGGRQTRRPGSGFLDLQGELGAQVVWDGLVLGASATVGRRVVGTDPGRWNWRVGLWTGWAWAV